jgi:rhamnogalacturonyl hydrolase YesR
MLAMQRYPWEQGVCAQALYEAGRDDLWIPMAYDAVKRQAPDGRLAMVGGEPAVSDPAACGEVCLRAYERTGDSFFLEGARRMLRYLLHDAPRTADGIICHNNVSFHEGYSARQLWVDGLYMVPPFLAAMGETKEAAGQIRGYIRHLFDGEAGLFFHIVDTADGRFVRQKHWATGNGWAAMGLARVTETAGEQGETKIREELASFLERLLEAMLALQLPDGRFHDILDEPDTFIDGTSALMTAAAVFRGILHGYADRRFCSRAETAYRTVLAKVDGTGLVREVCGCPDFLAEGTSAEAQAAFVMADTWRSRLADV